MSSEKKLFLVTGHPRSGTTYTRTVFEAAGLTVGGEHWGVPGREEGRPPVDGIVSWFHAVLLPDEIGPVVHQVRNPIAVIQSSQTLTNGAFRLMFRNTAAPAAWYALLRLRRLFPAISRRYSLHWAMHTWLYWNEMIERDPRVVMRFRVEDIETEWPNIIQAIGADAPTLPLEVPRDVNTRKDRYESKDLEAFRASAPDLADRILSKAREYGYEC